MLSWELLLLTTTSSQRPCSVLVYLDDGKAKGKPEYYQMEMYLVTRELNDISYDARPPDAIVVSH